MKTARYLAATALLALMVGLAWADAPATVELNIKSQPMTDALNKWAQATGFQVIFMEDKVTESLVAPEVKGRYIPRVALEKLLENSGLRFEYIGETTVAIRVGKKLRSSASPIEQMRLARLESAQEVATSNAGEDTNGQQVIVRDQRDRPAPFSTANIDLTRTEDDVLPFQVFTADEIMQSGASDLADFFRNRLTASYSAVIPEEDIDAGFGSAHAVSIASNRLNFANGAGTGGVLTEREVLILLNGRRMPSSYSAVTSGDSSPWLADFRSIPLSTIERIEILPSTAGAIYGGGANGAVINIITRRDYTGGSTTLRYEQPLDVARPKRSIDLAYSFAALSGRFSLSYGYSDVDPLRVRDRLEVGPKRLRELLLIRDPDRLISGVPVGATPNIASPSGGSLFGDGTPSFTSVPDGYAGGQGIDPFLSRQGVYNLEFPEGGQGISTGLNSQLGMRTETHNFSIAREQRIGENWDLFLQYSHKYSRMDGHSSNEFIYPGLRASASSPNNPFNREVRVVLYDPRLDRPELIKRFFTETTSLTASLVGTHGAWRSLFDLSYIGDVNRQKGVMFQLPLSAAGLPTRWANVVNAGLYNPFVDPRVVAPAEPSFYENYAQERARYESGTSNYQVSIKLSGPLLSLPAGSLHATTGIEWVQHDRDKVDFAYPVVHSRTGERFSETIVDWTHAMFTSNTYSLYGEASVPLLSEKQGLRLVKHLELFVAGRVSRQVTDGYNSLSSNSVFDPETNITYVTYDLEPISWRTRPYLHSIGLRYDIIDGVAIRLSRSSGFTPPFLDQVTPSLPPNYTIDVTDRITGQTRELPASAYIGGGNPDLEPETSTSDSIGLIFEPRWIPGLRVTADYTIGKREDAITSVSVQDVLDLESTDPLLADRVQRDAAGEITFVDARDINFRSIKSKVLNVALAQRFPNVFGGQLALTAAATLTRSLRVQTSALATPIERVKARGYGLINWNANAQVSWSNANWTLGWNARYFDDVLLSSSSFAAKGSDRIEWEIEHDMVVNYRPAAAGGRVGSWIEGMSFSFGIKNVFDREPRFNPGHPRMGIYTADSIMGRSGWLQIKVDF